MPGICAPAALGDALWRSEAEIPLADHRTPDWVDDLAARFSMLDIDSKAPPAIHAWETPGQPTTRD